ncbi:MAG: glucose-1-phosphate adenylyltransferase subunit GlgD [Clostridiales Family XIII bacterium]|jgi:glucose-1-phosphate adenylyltransferase|nr:glucose-1-phosphate adenylyltransferase subunit GlgD [Clostridiales Family XIII bacterium]
MIRDAFGLINGGVERRNLRELVDSRAVGALPIGCRYRAIDFPLSNMVNSGIRNVGVIASRNYSSLMNHLGSGKSWDLSRKSDGVTVITPYSVRGSTGTYRGEVEALKSSMDFIVHAKQEYCIISSVDYVFTGAFDDMMRRHVESGADITALYHIVGRHGDTDRYEETFFDFGEDGRINVIEFNPRNTRLKARDLRTYIIRKDLLILLVEESYAKGELGFTKDLLRNNLNRLRIIGFEHEGYVGTLFDVASFFKVNMDLLDQDLMREIFLSKNRIYTRVMDSVPAKYMKDSVVKNSLIANGCIIEGEVKNSLLFRNVHVGPNVVLKNCIVFKETEIGEGSDLEYVILDKNVSVRKGTRLIGNAEFPMVIKKQGTV